MIKLRPRVIQRKCQAHRYFTFQPASGIRLFSPFLSFFLPFFFPFKSVMVLKSNKYNKSSSGRDEFRLVNDFKDIQPFVYAETALGALAYFHCFARALFIPLSSRTSGENNELKNEQGLAGFLTPGTE